jgi:hypothetical protein
MHIVILVPFRDEPSQNRRFHFETFVREMPIRLRELSHCTWSILIGVQEHDGHKFARGRILNALFRRALEMHPTMDRIILHDIDLLPDTERVVGYGKEIPPDSVLSLNSTGEYAGMTHYIGGVCALHPRLFLQANGFPNELEGWGAEDDALRDRLGNENIQYFTRGTMDNLEVSVPGFARARNNDAFKMPKLERRRIRQLWKEYDPEVSGACQLRFAITREYLQTPSVFVFHLNLYLPPLPQHWITAWSKNKTRLYYFNNKTGSTQWHEPPQSCA